MFSDLFNFHSQKFKDLGHIGGFDILQLLYDDMEIGNWGVKRELKGS